METQIQVANPQELSAGGKNGFTPEQIQILKSTICPGLSDDEMSIFLMACAQSGLDPFLKQIYALPSKGEKGRMMVHVGIDGLRLIADRTGRYCPGREPTFQYTKEGRVYSATAYIRKMTKDGTWHEVSACAHLHEYMPRNAHPNSPWGKMPMAMLSKCAESLAIRKAFPAESGGLYTKEEMEQAELETKPSKKPEPQKIEELPKERASLKEAAFLYNLLRECEASYRAWVGDYLKENYETQHVDHIPYEVYKEILEQTQKEHAKAMQRKAEAEAEEAKRAEEAEYVDLPQNLDELVS